MASKTIKVVEGGGGGGGENPHFERALFLIKPDAVERGLIGEIIKRIEKLGFNIACMRLLEPSLKTLTEHYGEIGQVGVRHGEEVLERVVLSMMMRPTVALIVEGIEAIAVLRKINGATEPLSALPGTIRGDFGSQSYAYSKSKEAAIENLVHASATQEEAIKEINLWFSIKN